jgi:CRISPR system Cascade subunit CasA
MTYNLLNKSWLPCTMPDSSMCELGILEALVRAHDIREIVDSSPLVTFALHRLLLAILHRNFGPEDSAQWKILWDRGS